MAVHLEAGLFDGAEAMLQHHLNGVTVKTVLGLPQLRTVNHAFSHHDGTHTKRRLCHTPEKGLAKPVAALAELEFEVITQSLLLCLTPPGPGLRATQLQANGGFRHGWWRAAFQACRRGPSVHPPWRQCDLAL